MDQIAPEDALRDAAEVAAMFLRGMSLDPSLPEETRDACALTSDKIEGSIEAAGGADPMFGIKDHERRVYDLAQIAQTLCDDEHDALFALASAAGLIAVSLDRTDAAHDLLEVAIEGFEHARDDAEKSS